MKNSTIFLLTALFLHCSCLNLSSPLKYYVKKKETLKTVFSSITFDSNKQLPIRIKSIPSFHNSTSNSVEKRNNQQRLMENMDIVFSNKLLTDNIVRFLDRIFHYKKSPTISILDIRGNEYDIEKDNGYFYMNSLGSITLHEIICNFIPFN